MALSARAGYTSSDLVFQDDFSGTTLDNTWHPYITSNAANGAPWNSNGAGGSGGGNTYDVEYDMPSQVSVNNGTLDITATQRVGNHASGNHPTGGQVDHGQIATAVSQASNWLNESLLTRPQH
jgi:hypothetical protein